MLRRVNFGNSLFNDMFNYTVFDEMLEGFEGLVVSKDFVGTKVNGDYKYSIDLPGVKKEDVDITVEGVNCTVTARRKIKDETHNISKYLALPEGVDSSGISAILEDGVLSISFKEERKDIPKIKIPVT